MIAKGCDGATLRTFRTLFEVGAAGGLSDAELLDRARLGSVEAGERAFALLVERHGPMVLRTCRGMLGDLDSARDAFQETFIVLSRRAGTIRARDTLGPWLHRVAVHVAKRQRDAEARRRRHERRYAEASPIQSELLPTFPDDSAAILHDEIARLPDRLRAPLVLCDLEGLSIDQAAARLGHPPGTIKSRRSRARDRLRGRLIGRGLAPAVALTAATKAIATTPSSLPIGWAEAAAQAATTPGLSTLPGILHGGFKVLLLHKFKALTVGCALAGIGALEAALPGTEPGSDGPAAGVVVTKADHPEIEPASGPERPVAVLQEGLRGDDPRPSLPARLDEPVLLDPIPPIVGANELIRGPALLDFHAGWDGPSQQMRPVIDDLVRANYPVRSIDVDERPELVEHFNIDGVPTFVAIDAEGREIGRLVGLTRAEDLAAFFKQAFGVDPLPVVPPSLLAGPPIEKEPPLADLDDPAPGQPPFNGNPAPWETVVRITLKYNDSPGSGTVISSTDEESIILTCAHIFHVKGTQPRPDQFKLPVQVELFDGKLGGPGGQTVRPLGRPMGGEVIDYDFGRDVALVRIRPGRVLPASPIVPEGWSPREGMKMSTVGCTNGEDATAWSTTITDPSFSGLSEKPDYEAIQCLYSPRRGRSGCGLFTEDGYLAGVCNYAFDSRISRGLYASPNSIRAILDRNNLSFLYGKAAPPSGDVDREILEELAQRAEALIEHRQWDEAESTLSELKSRAQGAVESAEERRREIRKTMEIAEENLHTLDEQTAETDAPGFEREAEAMLRSVDRGRRSDPGPVASLSPAVPGRERVIHFAPTVAVLRDGHEPRPIGEIRDEVDAAFDEGAGAVRLGVEAELPGGGRLDVGLRVTDPSQVDEAVDVLRFMNGTGPIAIDRREDGPISERPE